MMSLLGKWPVIPNIVNKNFFHETLLSTKYPALKTKQQQQHPQNLAYN